MTALKTVVTAVSVETFVGAVQPPQRQHDARILTEVMTRITGEPPKMWGPSIIGFGRYHYRYESGREGDMCRIGFSPRKAKLVLYLVPYDTERDADLARLGKHQIGKGCLYINKLADVDMAVLENMIRASWARMAERYPTS